MSATVVLLGHRGVVGRAFADHLRETGARVIGVDSGNFATIGRVDADAVVNANGSSDRRLADENPLESFRLNVSVTLESLVRFQAPLYVHVSTIAVYPDRTDPSRCDEHAPIDADRLSNYGRFKLLAEYLVRGHARRWVIARLGPIVGPGLRKNSVFDLLAKRTLHFHPDSRLPYIDTRDAARIIWSVREHADLVVNVCGSGRVRLRDLATELGVRLPPEVETLPRDDWDVPVGRLRSLTAVPESATTVRSFVSEWAGR